jgi:hypothetical protein
MNTAKKSATHHAFTFHTRSITTVRSSVVMHHEDHARRSPPWS